MKVAVIGGGAAGFFAALSVAEHHPKAKITIVEKTSKLLSKVKVSGGGRCNVTNACTSIKELTQAYPRGGRALKKLFPIFSTQDTMDWFERRGVKLMVQEDQCVFPVSQDSQSIIDCFLKQASLSGIDIKTKAQVSKIEQMDDFRINLYFKDNEEVYDKVIVATGGSHKRKGLEWLKEIGHKVETPVPSLFTFNMPEEPIRDLMGIVVEETQTSIEGTKLKSDGPLLITHWGMSGPSILKLSAFGARILEDFDYQFVVQVNWVNEGNQNKVEASLQEIVSSHGEKKLSNYRPFGLPDRLWKFLCIKGEFPESKKWNELGRKGLNKLITLLTNDKYRVKGKTTFKEEFVTCGGVSLDSINMKTMESRVIKNLYFAGEVIDIDAITGGYNFQAAWTTGFIAGQLKK